MIAPAASARPTWPRPARNAAASVAVAAIGLRSGNRLLEAAAREPGAARPPEQPSARAGALDIEQAAERARRLFPQGTESSVGYIRSLRDNG